MSLMDKEIRLEIKDLTHDGKGVGRFNGQAIFVSGALPGETVVCTVKKVKKNFLEAELKKIITYSPDRIKAPCEVYENCGGCQIQHLVYKRQLEIKKNIVDNALKRIGGLSGYEIKDTLGMKHPWGYRNKVVFQVGKINGKVRLGFFKKGTNQLVPFIKCALLDMDMQNIALEIESVLNEAIRVEKIKRVLIRKSSATGEILVGFISVGEVSALKEIAINLIKKHTNLSSVVQNFIKNPGEPWGKNTGVLAGKEYITEKLGDIIYQISAASFFQVNSLQTKTLYEKVVEFSGLDKERIVFDVYCGTGSIALFLARHFKYVYGIESVKAAVNDAVKNAELNDIKNVQFIAGKAEIKMPELCKKGIRPEVVVVDPPRKGCHKSVLDTIMDVSPERLVYVSCNPATLARDLKYLNTGGFRVRLVQPVDMFAHTTHVETVVLMSRV